MATKMGSFTIFRGGPPQNHYVWSPFVCKLEARLRFDDVAYNLGVGSPKTAPRGKLPYLEINHAGTTEAISDSATIIRTFTSNGLLRDLNASLTPVQRAQDLALRAMMEEKVYFYTGREKWCDNYLTMRDGVLAPIPWVIRPIIGLLAYRANTNAMYGQGTGRLTDEEVQLLKEEVWESVNALLSEARHSSVDGDAPFWLLGGTNPTEADATMFGFVVSSLVCDA